MTKSTTLSEHLKKIQPLGGKALFKKVGRKGMIKLANRGWEKRRNNHKNHDKNKV